ncbi:hypothetical protein [Virgisporangium ochraceum]|uniref:hypothetical protein n=1 Tax=Virgisporangium ochraceum TaxID=65505 RepID=UPI00194332F2|nr:hypothetical protein [Virgisporangium ochraceum]
MERVLGRGRFRCGTPRLRLRLWLRLRLRLRLRLWLRLWLPRDRRRYVGGQLAGRGRLGVGCYLLGRRLFGRHFV